MRLFLFFLALGVSALPSSISAQMSTAELNYRLAAGQGDAAGVRELIQGASAARLLGDAEMAQKLLGSTTQFLAGVDNLWVNELILQAMASGRGVNGMQRAFREARERLNLSPQQIAAIANNYPTLLTGGEFDEMILNFAPDHPNPDYRCECLAPKAWVHRVAGRAEESRELWARLAEVRDRNPLPTDNAQAQGQYARDLARAGRTDEAQTVLERAMAMSVSDEQRPAVQRRWAQAFAELGDVEGAVAQLEPLLGTSTLVTVNSLSTRYTWEPIRDHPAFQAMLLAHR